MVIEVKNFLFDFSFLGLNLRPKSEKSTFWTRRFSQSLEIFVNLLHFCFESFTPEICCELWFLCIYPPLLTLVPIFKWLVYIQLILKPNYWVLCVLFSTSEPLSQARSTSIYIWFYNLYLFDNASWLKSLNKERIEFLKSTFCSLSHVTYSKGKFQILLSFLRAFSFKLS
jgi:hypothetical protein